MSSKPKLPAAGRATIEVDVSWLEAHERHADERTGRAEKKKLPPPIPGANRKGPPPMPVHSPPSLRPPRRETMEVKAEWLERESLLPVDDAPKSKRAGARASVTPPASKKNGARASVSPPSRKAASRASVTPPASTRSKRPKAPPIPRED